MTDVLMKNELKKHVAAIRISDKVGLLPRKMWNVLLLNAYDSLLTERKHSISVSLLSEIIGYNSKGYNELRSSLKKLRTIDIEWDVGNGCTVKGMWCPEVAGSTMLASSKIKDGILTYEFSSLLAELLHEPEIYQKINISQQKLFSASYSLALWENCIRFLGVGKTGLSEISEWKMLLGATNKTYDEFKYFNKYVLMPSINEINKVSSIEVELLQQKNGRKITHIGFLVKQKKQIQLAIPEVINEIKSTKEYDDLIGLGIQHIQAIAWLQEHDIKYIRSKIDLANDLYNKGRIKTSLSGFLVSAINKDYKSERELIQEKQEKEKKIRLEEERIKRKEEAISKAGLEFSKLEKEKFLQSLTEDQKEKLLQEVLEEVSLDSYAVAHIKKKGLESPSASLPIINRITDFSTRKNEFISKKLKESGF